MVAKYPRLLPCRKKALCETIFNFFIVSFEYKKTTWLKQVVFYINNTAVIRFELQHGF